MRAVRNCNSSPAFVAPAVSLKAGARHALSSSAPRAPRAPHRTLPSMQQEPSSRRAILKHLAAVPLTLIIPTASKAAAFKSGDVHAELSDLASKIPGAGMPDVYYPDFFLGDWIINRELYAVETMDLPSGKPDWVRGHTALSERAVDAMRTDIGRRQVFHQRFNMHRGHIIEDRLFNTRQELTAMARGAASSVAAVRARPAEGQRVDVTWEADNPNVTTVAWEVGGVSVAPGLGRRVVREAKVTKRAFVDGPQGYGTFVASEYARVVDFEGEGALLGFGRPPSIYGRRRIVRYKVSSVNRQFEPDGMDRVCVEYLYPPNPPNAKAAVLLKYRDFLNRVSRASELLGRG